MKQTLILALVFLSSVILFHNVGDDAPIIPKEAIRFRVLANSNSSYDQEIKEHVRDNLQSVLYDSLKDSTNHEAAKEIILNNLDNYDDEVFKTLQKYNYSLPYTIAYGNHYFPEKTYKGVTYEAGIYESLLVTLGSGKGDNWWCVLFPPLCLLEADETTEDVEYKFYVAELINQFFS